MSIMDRTSPAEVFEHHPLADASTEIRIWNLSSGLVSLPDGQRVPQCTLKHATLAEKPTYTAVLYTLGGSRIQVQFLSLGNARSFDGNQEARDLNRDHTSPPARTGIFSAVQTC